MRILFWRTYYLLTNPFRKLYWRIFRPKTRGVKCVIENEGKFLLVRITYAHKKWTFPGGGVKKGESFEQGARRELKEETGITPLFLQFFGEYKNEGEGKRDTVECFYGKTNISDIRIDPLEIAEAGWFRRGEFPQDRGSRVDLIMNLYDRHF